MDATEEPQTLDSLRETLVEADEPLLDALDRIAPALLAGAGGRRDLVLGPHLPALRDLRYNGHPWARLLVGMTLWDLSHDEDAALRFIEGAQRAFRRTRDVKGQGFAFYVLGNIALGRGSIAKAVRFWRKARELLGEESPAHDFNLSNLSLDAYFDGRLADAMNLAEEGIAAARMDRNRRAEGLALLYLAFFGLNAGRFDNAREAAALAEDVFSEIEPAENRNEAPLVHTIQATVRALGGDIAGAESDFERALALADEIATPWFRAITLAVRAELTAKVDPQRAVADARAALDELHKHRDDWWSTWAVRAHGVAARESGELRTSESILRRLLVKPLAPAERGRTLLALGETLLRARDPSAAGTLSGACDVLEATGCRYWHVEALLRLAEADPSKIGALRARARTLIENDPEYLHLLGDARLEVRMLGASAVRVDGVPACFNTRHAELLVYALALAQPHGLHWLELASRLWPGATAPKAANRLRTSLWEARKALDSEGWRLKRTGDRVLLDATGAAIDHLDATAAARAVIEDGDLREPGPIRRELQQPLLPEWAYEPWVQDANRDREALLHTLGT